MRDHFNAVPGQQRAMFGAVQARVTERLALKFTDGFSAAALIPCVRMHVVEAGDPIRRAGITRR